MERGIESKTKKLEKTQKSPSFIFLKKERHLNPFIPYSLTTNAFCSVWKKRKLACTNHNPIFTIPPIVTTFLSLFTTFCIKLNTYGIITIIFFFIDFFFFFIILNLFEQYLIENKRKKQIK